MMKNVGDGESTTTVRLRTGRDDDLHLCTGRRLNKKSLAAIHAHRYGNLHLSSLNERHVEEDVFTKNVDNFFGLLESCHHKSNWTPGTAIQLSRGKTDNPRMLEARGKLLLWKSVTV